MVRPKIQFESSMVERVRSGIRGNQCTSPAWWGAIKRVPPLAPPLRSGALPRITFALEDRLRQKYLARNPHARDEAIDLSRGVHKAVRRSRTWRFVYEWIVAMEDLGLPEEEAYRHVEAQQARNDTVPSSPNVTHLSLQWARLTDASIASAMQHVADANGTLPPNWSEESRSFESTQPGANVLVRSTDTHAVHDATSGPGAISGSAASTFGEHAGATGASAGTADAHTASGEVDDETRRVVEYARSAVATKVEVLEARLQELLAESAGDDAGAQSQVAVLEQMDAPVESLPEELLDLTVGATSGVSVPDNKPQH